MSPDDLTAIRHASPTAGRFFALIEDEYLSVFTTLRGDGVVVDGALSIKDWERLLRKFMRDDSRHGSEQ